MELDNDSTKLVHRTDTGGSNYWVLGLVFTLWVLSVALYLPGMP